MLELQSYYIVPIYIAILETSHTDRLFSNCLNVTTKYLFEFGSSSPLSSVDTALRTQAVCADPAWSTTFWDSAPRGAQREKVWTVDYTRIFERFSRSTLRQDFFFLRKFHLFCLYSNLSACTPRKRRGRLTTNPKIISHFRGRFQLYWCTSCLRVCCNEAFE